MSEFLRATALAERLGVTAQTISRWKGDGMPSVYSRRGITIFSLDEVVAWLKERSDSSANGNGGAPHG